ncbi:hypothetical protein ACLB1T_12650 [Escherichia coli]
MRQALRAANAKAEISIVYPDAGHAFNADYVADYRANLRKMAGSVCWNGLSSMVGRSRCNEKRPGGILHPVWIYRDANSAPPAPCSPVPRGFLASRAFSASISG